MRRARLSAACAGSVLTVAAASWAAVAAVSAGASGYSVAATVQATAVGASHPISGAAPEIGATVSPAEIALGQGVTVSGVLPAPSSAPSTALALQADPYPYRGYTTVARTRASPAGAFSFTAVRPDSDTRLRVVLESAPAIESAQLAVTVDPRVALAARGLGPGATRLSIRVTHTLHGGAGTSLAWWYLRASGSRVFRLAATTDTRELARACSTRARSSTSHTPLRLPRLPEPAVGSCDGGNGRAWPLPCTRLRPACRCRALTDSPACRCQRPSREHGCMVLWPSCLSVALACPRRVRAPLSSTVDRHTASRWAPTRPAARSPLRSVSSTTRAGRTSLAIVDSSGHVNGVRLHEHFESASVVKAMMLTAYLQMLAARHRALDSQDTSLLYPMIHISDNSAASAVLRDRRRGRACAGGARSRHERLRAVVRLVGLHADLRDRPGPVLRDARHDSSRSASMDMRVDLMSDDRARPRAGASRRSRAPAGRCSSRRARSPKRACSMRAPCSNEARAASRWRCSPTHDPSMAYGEETIAGIGARARGAHAVSASELAHLERRARRRGERPARLPPRARQRRARSAPARRRARPPAPLARRISSSAAHGVRLTRAPLVPGPPCRHTRPGDVRTRHERTWRRSTTGSGNGRESHPRAPSSAASRWAP